MSICFYGGCFIFSILHPCFVTPESGWERTKDGQKLHWNVDRYFYEGAYEQPLGGEEKMFLFHRTLTSYINTIDYSTRMLEIAKERTPDGLHIHYRHGNCEDLHFLDEQSFDIIISNMVIQDLANDEKAFQEMHRLLKDQRWNRFADSYAANHTEQGDIHKEVFLNPVIFSLIETVKNQKVLDAGCGEGYLSRMLAAREAVVTADSNSS
ncbi:class I SAM-dependent methyltransferase [Bacillus licheniformis]|nr:class I SAM-dependent methyltransferase [Bacillus licheniformis]